MAHLTKQEVISKIKEVLTAHGAVAMLSSFANSNDINVELGYENIDNDKLIDDLLSILWKDTSDVEINPCRSAYGEGKRYL